MNKTEAKFTTTNIPQVAFLLWKGILPDEIEMNLSNNLFLYFSDNDFSSIVRCYWEGDYIPACEMGSCIRLVNIMIRDMKIDKGYLQDELNEISEYRGWYNGDLPVFDNTIGDDENDYSDIIEKLRFEE